MQIRNPAIFTNSSSCLGKKHNQNIKVTELQKMSLKVAIDKVTNKKVVAYQTEWDQVKKNSKSNLSNP